MVGVLRPLSVIRFSERHTECACYFPGGEPLPNLLNPQIPNPLRIDVVLRADPLTAVMLTVVTLISLLVVV